MIQPQHILYLAFQERKPRLIHHLFMSRMKSGANHNQYPTVDHRHLFCRQKLLPLLHHRRKRQTTTHAKYMITTKYLSLPVLHYQLSRLEQSTACVSVLTDIFSHFLLSKQSNTGDIYGDVPPDPPPRPITLFKVHDMSHSFVPPQEQSRHALRYASSRKESSLKQLHGRLD